MKKTSSVRGYSLIELMITVAIVGILAALAAPSFKTMLMNNRQTAQTNAFVGALNYARSTALVQKSAAEVCPIGTTGSAICGTAWNSGWIVVTAPMAGAATLLQSYSIGPRDPTLSAVALVPISASGVTFDPRGLSTTSGQFKICDTRGATVASSIQVSIAGIIQVGPTPGQAVWGGALTCP